MRGASAGSLARSERNISAETPVDHVDIGTKRDDAGIIGDHKDFIHTPAAGGLNRYKGVM